MADENKSKTKTFWLYILAGIITLGVISFIIKYIFFSNPFYYAGTLEATKVSIAARLSAAINEVTVHEGDKVKKGQELIRFACENFKYDAKLAQRDYERNKSLVKYDFISQSVFDVYKNKMEDANVKVDWCVLSAPLDSTVLSRDHEPGEWMEPGTSILTIADIHDVYAYIYVPQPKIAKLYYGMKLIGHLPEMKGREFIGKIIKINSEAEFTPKNVQTQKERECLIYGVKVSFLESNQDEILKPGMTIEVALPR